MTEIVLHEEAFEEVRQQFVNAGLLSDDLVGFETYSEPFTVGGITFKLWEYIATPEDIARREALMATPYGKAMAEIFNRSNAALANMLADWEQDNAFMDGEQWPVGTYLKIRLPSDYTEKPNG